MVLNANEQYLLELINRARLGPAAEALRFGHDLNADLAANTISSSSKPALAASAILRSSAEAHSNWMLQSNVFSHTGRNDTSPGDRMLAAGYQFSGDWAWRENLAWTGTTRSLSLTDAIDVHHQGLFLSSGHRVNTFASNIREIGIAQIEGEFEQNGTIYNASMLSLNFAQTGSEPFVTGVAYRDIDNDQFYDIGEGISDISFAVLGNVYTTTVAGGYAIAVASSQTARVTVADPTKTLGVLDIEAAAHNAKLDYVISANGTRQAHLSSSATIVSGIADATMLGLDNLSLSGNNQDNTLTGNAGRNILEGRAGNDILSGDGGEDSLFGGSGDDLLRGGSGRDMGWEDENSAQTHHADLLSGGSGDDQLYGMAGFDILSGGTGNDTLIGGGGRDTFVFQQGHDEILDFAPNVDQLSVETERFGNLTLNHETIEDFAIVNEGSTILRLSDEDQITLAGIASLDLIIDDILFV